MIAWYLASCRADDGETCRRTARKIFQASSQDARSITRLFAELESRERFAACPACTASVSSITGNSNLSNATNLPRRMRLIRYFAGVAEQEVKGGSENDSRLLDLLRLRWCLRRSLELPEESDEHELLLLLSVWW